MSGMFYLDYKVIMTSILQSKMPRTVQLMTYTTLKCNLVSFWYHQEAIQGSSCCTRMWPPDTSALTMVNNFIHIYDSEDLLKDVANENNDNTNAEDACNRL